MVFRKFKPQKQWGRMDTRIFKNILAARNKRKMPRFVIPPAVKEAGIKIYDPNSPDFFTTDVQELPVIPHPAHKIPQLHEHPLYKSVQCSLFDGTVAFSDGIDQACSLSKAVKRIGFPEAVLDLASKIPLPECFEDHLSDCIMHAERYDPTLEKLPRYFDPIIFWTRYFPNRVHGTPVLTRGKIILDNLFRTAHHIALQHSQLSDLRYDRDEPLSAILQVGSTENKKIPFVLRLEPHIIVQSPEPIKPWTKAVGLFNMQVPNIAPINPRIDLTSDHIYNDNVLLPRVKENLFIDTVMWCHEQNQKYPWTVEQLGAKAVMVCFGAAVAQATRHGQFDFKNLENQPVVTRAVQLVNGRLDLVVFQLNTLDLDPDNQCKNVVWIEPGLQLYKCGKFTENLDAVKDLCVDTFRKFMAFLRVLCMSEALLLSQHLKFLREHLIALPASYRSFDSNRAAILYFTLSTLDVLGKLEEEIDAELRRNIIEWIYRLQLKSDSEIMGFCAPRTPNFGFLDTGCSVLGGIRVNPNIENQEPNCASNDFYISQHNLAHHWQRPYMVPHTVGFPHLLTRTMSCVRDCMATRHAGHWPFETPSNRLKNRNLLEVLENPDDGSVILWSVNELSTRKRLLEFRLHRVKDEGFDEWRILTDEDDEDQEICDSERAEMSEMNRNFSSDDEISTEQQIHNQKYYRSLNVNTALLELRSWKPTGERCRILARSEKELYLCDPENNTVLTLFRHPVHSLSFIPYMNDEIVFLDDGGLIWYGEVGENFTRAKCKYDLESIVGSDHPRLIYAAEKDNVHLIDLRVSISDGDLLYSVPEYDDTSRNSYHFQYKDAFEKETIHQLYSLPDTPQMVLICTSRKFVLVDERMRGHSCLEMAHSIYHGGHHVTSAPPIRDTDKNGTIYPIYILQHTIYPDVQTFSLYRHSDSMIWSSLASIRRLQEPRSAAAFYEEQPKYNVRIPRLGEKLLFGNGPTRAISFLSTDVNSNNQKLFLFRMMDDGSLWYEQISIQNDQDLMEEMLWREASKVKDLVNSNTSGMEWSDDLCCGSSQKKSKIFDVEFDLDALENLAFDINIETLQPLDTHPENSYPDPEIMRDVVDEQLFSKIVLQGYPKDAYGFRGSLGFSKPSWYKAEIHGGGGGGGGGDVDRTKSDISITANCFLYDSAHISQTYVALCSLLILGDDLSRVDRKAVLEGVCCDQLNDGSFRGQRETENDMRFVYCAIAICYILNDFSTINMKSVLKFIQRCVNFDGGIGQAPYLESHGGSTFCAIAALAMAGHLWDESVLTHKQIEKLVKWAIWKQNEGFHGRANKPDDSCYAFWIGGTLKILDAYMFVDIERLRSFIYSTQDRMLGGFGKFSDVVPDALHTCYSISALSLLHEPKLRIIYPPLNITKRAAEHLANINVNQYDASFQ